MRTQIVLPFDVLVVEVLDNALLRRMAGPKAIYNILPVFVQSRSEAINTLCPTSKRKHTIPFVGYVRPEDRNRAPSLGIRAAVMKDLGRRLTVVKD